MIEYTLPEMVKKDKYSLKRGPFGGSLKKDCFVKSGFKVYEQKNAIYKNFDLGEYFINQSKFDELKAFKVKPKDLIISCSGTIGKIAEIPENAEEGIINQALLKLSLNQELVTNQYFTYLFNSSTIQNEIFGVSHGSGIKNFPPMSTLKKIKFPLPKLSNQKKIASILDEADKIRILNKQLIAKYDALTQSLFLDMFGDPVTNPKGWDKIVLNKLVTKLGDGLHGTPNYSDEGEYYFINGNNLIDGKVVITERTKKINYDEYLKIKKELDSTTMFVSINGTIGKVAFYNGEKIALGKSACYFNIKEDLLNKTFLYYIFNCGYFIHYTTGNVTGSTIKNVSLKSMRNFPILFPPKELQNQFAERVQIIENQKQQAEASLQKSEDLFNSLLQKAFKGELVKE